MKLSYCLKLTHKTNRKAGNTDKGFMMWVEMQFVNDKE